MRRVAFFVALLLAAPIVSGPQASAAPVLPAGFADELVTSVGVPTGIAWTPDGRMLVTTQSGRLRIVQNGALLATPALDLSAKVCSNSERGLLGAAVDPAFATNGYIYLYYTFNKFNTCPTNSSSAPVNRVSRFVLGGSNTINPASETVLIDNIPSYGGNHNAGDLNFGKDGYLYVSVGDGGCDYAGGGCGGSNNAARDRHVLLGKVLRITRDGAIPWSNPWQGSGTARCNVTGRTTAGLRCRETFAWGLRNPFRFAFDPNAGGTRFYINDVGQNAWEEIDLGASGADYGWNVREGHCATGSTTNCGAPPSGMTNPIFDYGRSDGCASITGGAFVPNGTWPAPYAGSYLFGDYVCGRIFRLAPNGSGGFTREVLATGLGSSSAVHLAFGPHGGTRTLYYTTYANGGEIHRIVLTGANRPPTASFTASPSSGAAPLTVNFDASASSDPDGDTLTYQWIFGDGQTQTMSVPTTSHPYTSNGTYTASLTVTDPDGATSVPATRTISVGNSAPSPQITAPTSTKRFSVGEAITLTGSATDTQDGTIPSSGLSWTVILHHATHTHPFLGPVTGNNITFQAPAPEDLAAASNSYLEIFLTATDSGGLSSTVARNLNPLKVNLTFATYPAGLKLDVQGVQITAPKTYASWKGYRIALNAPDQGSWRFRFWSNWGARSQTITTPEYARTYTAYFRSA